MLIAIMMLSFVQLSLGSHEQHAALHFQRILSQSEIAKEKTHAKIKPCGTGLEGTGTFSVEATKPDCINEVFKITAVTAIPTTAMVPIWLAEKLTEESTNDTPYIRRFAIVMSTAVSVVRQLLEEQVFSSFLSVWGGFSGKLFRPSSALTLKYVKGTVLKMMAADIVKQIIDIVASPCDLIPDVGVSFIGSINFQLSKWCRFGVTSVLKRLLNALIAKVEPFIQKAAGKKAELKCFQLDKVTKLLTGRIDKTYTVYNGSPEDLANILTPDCMIKPPEPPVEKPGTPECCNVCKAEEPKAKFMFKGMKETKDPGINAIMQTQLAPWSLKGEILRYGIMALLEGLMDVVYDGVQDQLKSFVSWTNKFL